MNMGTPLVGLWQVWSPWLLLETLVQWVWRKVQESYFRKSRGLWYRRSLDHMLETLPEEVTNLIYLKTYLAKGTDIFRPSLYEYPLFF